MGILQNPIKALDQAEWYLDNRELELFPGAFELAAGNLSRQLVEQILFVLCFFSGAPKREFFFGGKSRRLVTAGQMITVLNQRKGGRTYWYWAGIRGPRLAKLAKKRHRITRWQKALNEPSHFSPRFRRVDEQWVREFISEGRALLDTKDWHLVIAAVNDLFSGGEASAILSDDSDNSPGIRLTSRFNLRSLGRREDGSLTFSGRPARVQVISATEVPRGRWPKRPVVPQGMTGLVFQFRLVTHDGRPVDVTNIHTAIQTLCTTRRQGLAVVKKLRELGFPASLEEA